MPDHSDDAHALTMLKGAGIGVGDAIDKASHCHIDRSLGLRKHAAKLAYERVPPEVGPSKCHGPPHPTNGEEGEHLGDDGEPTGVFSHSKALKRVGDAGAAVGTDFGEPDPAAYRSLRHALKTDRPADFEDIDVTRAQPGVQAFRYRKLTNPQAGLDYDLEGPDSHGLVLQPAPRIDSVQNSREAGEVYWMAVLRDVPLHYLRDDVSPPVPPGDVVAAAVASLGPTGEFSVFDGSTKGGAFTRGALFRGNEPGVLDGPYISQFLLRGNKGNFIRVVGGAPREVITQQAIEGKISFGPGVADQRQMTVRPASDFMADPQDWRNVQEGLDTTGRDVFDVTDIALVPPTGPIQATPNPRFIRSLRDLANYAHICDIYSQYLNAALIMLGENDAERNLARVEGRAPRLPFPFSPGNPYNPPVDPADPMGNPSGTQPSMTQDGFATFDMSHLLSLLAEVAWRAHKAVWFQKWQVHRRMRPEEFGGRVHFQITSNRYPGAIDPEIIQALTTKPAGVARNLSDYFGPGKPFPTYLLPQAYPEGSPTHPSYAQGHATLAGASVTMLKAFFDEEQEITDKFIVDPSLIVDPDQDGTNLIVDPNGGTYTLTVGGELNKLAANIALGRDAAGVHYRSDYLAGTRLGEKLAVGILQEQTLAFTKGGTHVRSFNERVRLKSGAYEPPFFRFTSFDGIAVRISEGTVTPSNFLARPIP